MRQSPYVFISYSQESDEHIHRVLTYAQWLRAHGVEAHVDKFEQSPPKGWQLWCYDQVQKADYVLVVCTAAYNRRVMREEHEGVGRGVTWEGAIITSELYDQTRGQNKFIPVAFSRADLQYIPFFLKSFSHYVLEDERSATDLYRRITDQPEYVPAPVGRVVDFPQARLETPLPVVPLPAPGGPVSQAAPPAPQPVPRATARLADVIEGGWTVQIQGPILGTQMMRIKMTKGLLGRRQFVASAIVGPPGWKAEGTWEILPGEQLALNGTQLMLQPFPQSFVYQALNQFYSITPTEMHGMTPASETVIWRRES